jgi:N-acetylglutamate synthase-like GNAT family acetyltransferase
MQKTNPLKKINPSKYVVYQMLEATKIFHKANIITKSFKGVFLIKTKPFIDELYNYAFVIKDNLIKEDIKLIKKFFGKEKYNIKILQNKKVHKFLIQQGYKFKYPGNTMVNKKIKKYSIKLPRNIEIKQAITQKIINDSKKIFAKSFNHTLKETNKKFGFFDKIAKDKSNNHINIFVLYENNKPVSTGAYYVFDKFSVENIGTIPEYRKKGYAHLILQKLLNEAKKLNCKEACLVASVQGAKVYKDFGFRIINKTQTFTINQS